MKYFMDNYIEENFESVSGSNEFLSLPRIKVRKRKILHFSICFIRIDLDKVDKFNVTFPVTVFFKSTCRACAPYKKFFVLFFIQKIHVQIF